MQILLRELCRLHSLPEPAEVDQLSLPDVLGWQHGMVRAAASKAEEEMEEDDDDDDEEAEEDLHLEMDEVEVPSKSKVPVIH